MTVWATYIVFVSDLVCIGSCLCLTRIEAQVTILVLYPGLRLHIILHHCTTAYW